MVGIKVARYQILEEVGRGGMSVVYRATDTDLDRPVALKVLHEHLAPREDVIDRFRREAKAVARLHHENLLEIYDFSSDGTERSFLVTEFIDGLDLAAFLEQHKIRIPELGALIVAEMAAGLAHAHAAGVIHRDIKPQNVMLRNDGTVKLTDFGIARLLDQSQMTMTGTLLGSPAHMCPELVSGEPVDARGDIFSAGTLLYQCITGELPFQADNPSALLRRIVDIEYLPPEAVNPAVSRTLSCITARCLERNPDDRYPDASTLRDALLAVAAEVELTEPRAEIAALLAGSDARQDELQPLVVTRLKSRGAELLRAKQLSAALERYDSALALAPDDAEIPLIIDRIARRRRLVEMTRRCGIAALAAVAVLGLALAAVASGIFDRNPLPASEAAAGGRPGAPEPEAKAALMSLPEDGLPGSGGGEFEGRKVVTRPVTAAGALHAKAVGVPRAIPGKITRRNGGAKPPLADFTATRVVHTNFVAHVFVDGERKGRSPPPVKLELGPGKHKLELTNDTCEPTVMDLEITEPGEARLPVNMYCPARLELTAPQGALVFVGEQFKGSTPLRKALEVDWPEWDTEREFHIRVSKHGFKTFKKKLPLKRGKNEPLDVKLEPAP